MQNETGLYEVPPQQLLYTHKGLGEERELGEATVVSTIFGKARVRIVGQKNPSGWLWLLAALAWLGVMAAIWLMQAPPAPGTGSPAAPPAQPNPHISTETTPAALPVNESPLSAPQSNVTQSTAPQISAPPAPAPTPAPAPAAATLAAQPPIAQPGEAAPAKPAPAKKHPVAHKPAIADKPMAPAAGDKQPAPAKKTEHASEPQAFVPVTIKPVATQPVIEITKTTKPADQPAPGNGASTTPPAASGQPGQTGAQP